MRLTPRTRAVPRDVPRDDGSALIIGLMVTALVGAVATSAAVIAISNTQSANLARSAGVAVHAADAGISQGISYLRANGVSAVQTCANPTTTDPTAVEFSAFDLGSQRCVGGLADTHVEPVTGQPYSVLIAPIVDYATGRTGEYRIVAQGEGTLRAARIVSADVEAEGSGLAEGALQAKSFAGVGNTTIKNQSIFAQGCVTDRKHLTLSGLDAFGLPAAVHSESSIGENNGCSSKLIHPPACNGTYKYDQDANGGPLSDGSSCLPAGAGDYYANGSLLEPGDLEEVYGIRFPPLADEDIERLRQIAIAQGNRRTPSNSGTAFTPNGNNAVVFYDMAGGQTVDLSNIDGFTYEGTCEDRSLVVVIRGASARWTKNSVQPLMATVFVVTEGEEWYNTGGGLVGSVYADSIVIGGAVSNGGPAQECANSHPSPATMTFTVTNHRELDS